MYHLDASVPETGKVIEKAQFEKLCKLSLSNAQNALSGTKSEFECFHLVSCFVEICDDDNSQVRWVHLLLLESG